MKPGEEIVAYSPTKAALADLTARFKGLVFDVTTPKGMADAKAAHKEIAAHRITLEKAREAEKAESLAYGRYVDSEAKKIAEQIAALEDPIKQQIEVETKREQRAREEAVRLETERLAKEEADRKAAEEAKLAKEREELARQRAELEAKEKARLEVEAESRRKTEESERASRARIEEQERAARELVEKATREAEALRRAELERQRVADEARRKAEAEVEAKAKAEREAKEEAERKVRAEAEAKAKAEQDRKDAEARERQRLVLEKADSRTSLELWRKRYGHLPEYAGVVRAIDECLEPA